MLQTHLGRREDALDLYKKAARLEPKHAMHFYNVACMQRSLGELEAAEGNYDEAIRLNPDDFESYKFRSDLRVQTDDRNHVAELEQLLAGDIEDERDRVQVCYALAKELEDLGEAERSFKHLKAGSDRRRKLMRYEVDRDLETIEAIRARLVARFLMALVMGVRPVNPFSFWGCRERALRWLSESWRVIRMFSRPVS